MDTPAGERTGLIPWEIMGVIRSVKTGGLSEAELSVPEIYVSLRQSPTDSLYIAVRTAGGEPASLVPQLRAALKGIDAEVPASGVLTMSERLGLSVRLQRFRTGLISGFALLAGLLACIGVYGVRARAVASRRREMGLRLALGAMRSDITAAVVGEGLKLVGAGMLIGVAGALLVGRMFTQWLFATTVADPSALAIAAVALGAAALAACWIPARRAGRVDPLVALRDD
jgi:putative ABC transport system permease protein